MDGDRENQQVNRPDYSLLSYGELIWISANYYKDSGNKQTEQRKQRERFRKPAPQCVFWENRHHRQETGCTLWHPRESCRFYPTCAHEVILLISYNYLSFYSFLLLRMTRHVS